MAARLTSPKKGTSSHDLAFRMLAFLLSLGVALVACAPTEIIDSRIAALEAHVHDLAKAQSVTKLSEDCSSDFVSSARCGTQCDAVYSSRSDGRFALP